MMRSPSPDLSAAELTLRLRQQQLVVSFGRFSLRNDDLQMILDQACVIAADGLDTTFAKVLQFDAARNDFLVRAGIGWREGIVGHARLAGDLASPAGYAFKTGEPVISNRLADEARFRTPDILTEHGIQSAINVLIGGDDIARFGVLEVDSTARAEFGVHDLMFLDALANTLADAVEKQKRLDEAVRREAFALGVLNASPDCIKVMSADGALQMMNANGLCLMEIDDFAAFRGRNWVDTWPEEERGKVVDAMRAALGGRQGRFQGFCPTARGTPKWWDVVVAVLDGRPQQLVSISRDISDIVNAAEAKDALLREKDLLMQEVHHRVKNGLQMVQNLLMLQGRALREPTLSAALDESAARVHTIAALHERLYRSGSALQVEIEPYLRGLIDDLRDGLSSGPDGRDIRLQADHAVWAASDVPTIGLVLTELVTNALKYGAGAIDVSFRQQDGDVATLTVADEGPGVPADFDPAKSRGLGMRIVLGLLRGRDGRLEIDRQSPTTTFTAVMSAKEAVLF